MPPITTRPAAPPAAPPSDFEAFRQQRDAERLEADKAEFERHQAAEAMAARQREQKERHEREMDAMQDRRAADTAPSFQVVALGIILGRIAQLAAGDSYATAALTEIRQRASNLLSAVGGMAVREQVQAEIDRRLNEVMAKGK